ncbi:MULTISPECIES: phospholipase D-like domain-containing protein [unclassified Microcoleus]|uniref:phospholipase D-like domain-containing protein n=1 Tax=unclassified Microcoleus TaxID=2642155 RepID=UPI002FD73891
MRKPPYYYLKNISRRWHAEIKKLDDNDKLIILSPYLTSKTAEGILRDSQVANCEVYTIFSVHNFISGGSSLKTLKKLYERGCQLYHLPRLHAKIIISPGRFATIGSQNLTRNGVKNKEASVITFDNKEVEKIELLLNKWIFQRKPITFEMIQQLELKIKDLRKKFSLINRELKKEMNDLEIEFWEEQRLIEEAEVKRQEEEMRQQEEMRQKEEWRQKEELRKQRLIEEAEKIRLKEELRQQEEVRKQQEFRRNIVNTTISKLQQLIPNGRIEKELAEEFIRASASMDHPQGYGICSVPNDYKRIENDNNQWIIYKGNSFSISYAIYNCQQTLLEFLQQIDSGNVMSRSLLLEKLNLIVRGSVFNSNGYRYTNYTDNFGDYIWFGNHGICISDFVNLILTKGNINDNLFDLID